MHRRNHFKLMQGCDPWNCTNCSCEGCKKNKLGLTRYVAASEADAPASETQPIDEKRPGIFGIPRNTALIIGAVAVGGIVYFARQRRKGGRR